MSFISSTNLFYEAKRSYPYAKENMHFKFLQSEIDRHKNELGKDHIELEHNGKMYRISHAEQIGRAGDKADFKLHSIDGDHIFLSHKDVKEERHARGQSLHRSYNQLSGTSEYSNHPAVKALVEHTKEWVKAKGKMQGTHAAKLDLNNEEHHDLIKKAVFGKDYGQEEHGPNNIHSIVHGKMNINYHNGRLRLNPTEMVHYNEQLENNFMIYSRTDNARSDHGIEGARFSIGHVKSRGVKEGNWVKGFEHKPDKQEEEYKWNIIPKKERDHSWINFDDEDEKNIKENFIDGRNPDDKGDSKRHGINTKGSDSSLKKIRSSDSASPRKKQLAHWLLNMRKGRRKKAKNG